MSRDIRAIWQIKKQSEFFSLIVVSVAIVGGLILNFIFGKMGMDEDYIGDVILGAMSFAYILMNFFILSPPYARLSFLLMIKRVIRK